MKRRLFTFCSALSLLLFVAVCVLWVRSYWVTDLLGRSAAQLTSGRWVDEETYGLFSEGGGITAAHISSRRTPEGYPIRPSAPPPRFFDESGWITEPVERPSKLATQKTGRFGFRASDGFGGGYLAHRRWWFITVPHWFLALLTVAIPASRLYATARCRWCVRRARSARGRCPTCGYDLRATPDRCPECGTAVSSPTPA